MLRLRTIICIFHMLIHVISLEWCGQWSARSFLANIFRFILSWCFTKSSEISNRHWTTGLSPGNGSSIWLVASTGLFVFVNYVHIDILLVLITIDLLLHIDWRWSYTSVFLFIWWFRIRFRSDWRSSFIFWRFLLNIFGILSIISNSWWQISSSWVRSQSSSSW